MRVNSVRLDKATETRLRQEAEAQGIRFSNFLRERLIGKRKEVNDMDLRAMTEMLDGVLRQISEFLVHLRQEQAESDYFTQMLVTNSLQKLTRSQESAKKVWHISRQATKDHFAKQQADKSS